MNKFLATALAEAKKAERKAEVPIGAVVVLNDKIIARAHNLREAKQDPITHAEILAVKKAAKKIGSWRLIDCDVYVTLEPCPMCAGALSQARVRNVFYGARDSKAGVQSLNIRIHNHPKLNHRFDLIFVDTPECGSILSQFFKKRRTVKNKSV